ncbi:MAG: PCP reductase family protein [Candidatus Rokubacteria bacterium]|nr:PCP reductase family protein [Candidatus Rokubacteria bacterium]
MLWTAEAEERLRRIPVPFVRERIIRRVEALARQQGLEVVDLQAFEAGSSGGRRWWSGGAGGGGCGPTSPEKEAEP